ncbi:Fc.00g094230.m01.CDS01 [Cosmosporella sp. VM-42]
MADQHHVQIPRAGATTTSFTYQSEDGSDRLNAWLVEGEKQMPFHDLASVAKTSQQKKDFSSSIQESTTNAATAGNTR